MSSMKKLGLGTSCAFALLVVSQAQAQDAPATDPPVSERTSTDVNEAAETTPAELPEAEAHHQELSEEVQALRAELEKERAVREEEHAKLSEKLDEALGRGEAKRAAPKPTNLSEQSSAMKPHDTMRGDHHLSPRPGNAPLDPSYEGFLPLFEGKTWVKFGGYAKIDAMVDSTRIGNPNKFVTASIPVEGDAEFDSPSQFNLIAKQSRLNFELRAPSQVGSVRFVYENDFFGNSASSGMVYNLRHLYIQFANLTVGQTWTTFLDSDALPDTLDFAGPGMKSVLRQPQVRYTFSPIPEKLHIALAAEAPNTDLTLPAGAEARRRAPDMTTSVRFEGGLGHVQLGALGRVLSYDNGGAEGGDSAFGYGVSASTKVNVGNKDSFLGTITYGDGVGRYMQDLGTSLAGYVDADGDVETIAAFGFFLGYRHFWIDSLRSQITYGYLDLESNQDLGTGAYHQTHYGQANLVWSPFDAMSFGGELLYGHKTTQDDSQGEAFRGMLSLKYKLN